MSTQVWFDDIKQIVRSDRVTQFWPNDRQSVEERVNAASRFIIYGTCVLYATKRDLRVFILGAMALAILYVMYENGMIESPAVLDVAAPASATASATASAPCRAPSEDNPMANVLLADTGSEPRACPYGDVKEFVQHFAENRVEYDAGRSRTALPIYQRNAHARQFVSVPGHAEDQTAFAEWLYGKKSASTCRTDPSRCDPNVRGVQLEAYGGIGDGTSHGRLGSRFSQSTP
jgi:hypothetical protein